MKKYEKPVVEIQNLFSDLPVASDIDLYEDYFETGVSLNDYNIWNDVFGPLN